MSQWVESLDDSTRDGHLTEDEILISEDSKILEPIERVVPVIIKA
jgi:hypothetical protein